MNRLVVRHLIPLIKENLERSPELDQAKQAMAESFLESIIQDYRTKANGGTGEDGIRWEPTLKFLLQQGLILIRSGNLLRGFRIEITETGFKVYNDVDYAYIQFIKRMPWPTDQIPPTWLKRMLDAGRPYLMQALARSVRDSVEQSGATVIDETIR